MYYGEKKIENPIRWAMVGGGKAARLVISIVPRH